MQKKTAKKLSEIESAIRLKISPGLLKHFSKHAVKYKEKTKLPCEVNDGARWYLTTDLDIFDSYLREPWPKAKNAQRPSLPPKIKDEIKHEAGYICAVCGFESAGEAAHIEPVSKTQSHHPSNAWVSPIKFGYVDTPNFPEYDPGKCQQLLAEAGFPRGEGLPKLEYFTSVGFYPKTKEYGAVISSMLREQGFDIEYLPMTIGEWAERLYDRPGGGPGHMIDCGWATGSPEPDLVLRTHFHSSSKRICGIEDAELDAILDKERGEADPKRRKRIIQKEVMPMLADKVPALNLFTSVFIHAMRADLRGLYIYPNGMMDAIKATNV